MNMILKQAREGIVDAIKTNKTKGILYRQPTVDNGYGEMVSDPTKSPVPYSIACSIIHESQGAFKNIQSPSGLATQFDRYILVDWKILIIENDTFIDENNQNWRVGPVDILRRAGGVIGSQAPLFKADEI